MALAAGVVVTIVVVVAAAYFLMPAKEGDNGEEPAQTQVTVNGKAYTWKDMDDLEMKTVNGTTGVSLSALINFSGLSGQQDRQYRILASDGFAKNVTWGNMMEGVLVKTEDGKNVSYKTTFSTLPKRYSVKNVVDIQVITTDVLNVTGRQYTWEQPFDNMFESVNISGFDGIRLSDLVNHTGLANPANYNYTLMASDGYNKTVTWSNVQSGVLVLDGHKTAFEGLAKGYQVKNLVDIKAVPPL